MISVKAPSRSAATAALCLLSMIVVSGRGSAAVAAVASGNPDCVTRAQLVGATHGVRADGSVAANAAVAGAYATRYVYRLPGGLFTQVSPPAGWSPVRATDQELRTYGFPARPKDAAGRARWNKLFSTWK